MKTQNNDEKEDNSFEILDDIEIIKEEKVKVGENLSIKNAKILPEKAEKSVCEIIKDNGYGSGFFCKLKYPDNFHEMHCLFSNNHVITEEMLLNKENIEIKFKNEIIKISLYLYRRIWTDKFLDFTCIEILKEDNILEKIESFEIDENCYNSLYDYTKLNKRGIIIPSIGESKEIEISQGAIFCIKNRGDLFLHNCNTEGGFSGGPIILINNLTIIGIHCGYEKKSNKNIGIYFQEILKNITKEKQMFGKQIDCILDIKINDIESGIYIINQNENNGDVFNDNLKIFLDNKKVNIIKEKDLSARDRFKYKIDYNFKKDGNYLFNIVFNNEIDDLKGLFNSCSKIISIDFSNFEASKITHTGWMFNECQNLKKIMGLNNFDTSQVSNMAAMFQNCLELEYIDLSNFDTSMVSTMEAMFAGCKKLKEIKGIDKFNTSKVSNFRSTFSLCGIESLNLSNFNTSNATTMVTMFYNASKLKEIKGIINFNTSQVTSMRSMFNGCSELRYIDISSFDTSNLIDIQKMFCGCHNLKEIKGINLLNPNKATDINALFMDCYSIDYLDLSNFDTSNVTNMRALFSGCQKIKEIKGINRFNTKQVINMKSMFSQCYELEFLDLLNFDTSNVTDMSFMFNECYKLSNIKGIEKFNTKNVINMKSMFNNCSKLEKLDLSSFDTSNVNDMSFMFLKCNKLKYLNLLNFTLKSNCKTEEMFVFFSSEDCEFFTNNEKIYKLFNKKICLIY